MRDCCRCLILLVASSSTDRLRIHIDSMILNGIIGLELPPELPRGEERLPKRAYRLGNHSVSHDRD
jgi:hypothetical protein